MPVKYDYPQNSVVVWTRPLSEIPEGWALCDGNNGTLDLRGDFLRGEGSSNAPSFGGSDSVNMGAGNLPSHKHGITSNSGSVGSHVHEDAKDEATLENDTTNDLLAINAFYENVDMSNYNHSHSQSTGSTGGGQPIDNRPKSIEVALIQQV